MPLQRCELDGAPGWRWGNAPSAKCYTYTAGDEASETAARKKAMAQAAAMGEFPGTGERHADGPVEILHFRSKAVSEDVNFTDRIIEVIAVPWDEEAEIRWRGDIWREAFERGAFNEVIEKSVRIPVNREHVRGDTVGRVVNMADEPGGLMASVKVAKTPRGDDTLQLASEGMLGASVGYFVRGLSDVVLDKHSMLRRVKRAFLDHLSMVESPAFLGAKSLAVHDDLPIDLESGLRVPVTPSLDEWMADDILSWASSRLSK